MKKLQYGIMWFILIFIVLAGLQYTMAYLFEKKYYETINLISRQAKFNVKLVHYHRGFFHSDVVLVSSLPLADQVLDSTHPLDQKNVLLIKQRIYQGPIIFYFDSLTHKFQFLLAAAFIDTYFDQNHHFAQTLISLGDKLQTKFNLKEFILLDKNTHASIYSLQGLSGNLNIDKKGTFLSSFISCKCIESYVENPRRIQNFSAINNLQKNSLGIWTGKRDWRMEAIAWQQNNNRYEFIGFKYTIDSQFINNHLQADIKSSVKSARVNDIDYGVERISMNVRNIDGALFKELTSLFDDSSLQYNQIKQTQEELVSLLAKGAHIQINDLYLNTQWGQVIGRADIAFPNTTATQDFSQLMSLAEAKVIVKIPSSLVHSFLSNIYLLRSNRANLELAKQQATDSITKWSTTNWLVNTGKDIWINLK